MRAIREGSQAGTLEDGIRETVAALAAADADADTVRYEWLDESLHRRNPYVDPLNLLQCHLLADDDRTEAEEQTLRLTVKGIAAGMEKHGETPARAAGSTPVGGGSRPAGQWFHDAFAGSTTRSSRSTPSIAATSSSSSSTSRAA